MSRYLVKTKYTYEKVRQTDYTYAADNWALSQNHNTVNFSLSPVFKLSVSLFKQTSDTH